MTLLIGHGIHHKGALYNAVDMHPYPRLVSNRLSVDMHASDSSDTIGNIQVYLCHTVTRHTPLVKQLNVKMPLCVDIMPRKYLDEIQAPN